MTIWVIAKRRIRDRPRSLPRIEEAVARIGGHWDEEEWWSIPFRDRSSLSLDHSYALKTPFDDLGMIHSLRKADRNESITPFAINRG